MSEARSGVPVGGERPVTVDSGALRPVDGLTSAEAADRLARLGPNEVPEPRRSRWREFVGRFWGPLPWMLEVTIVASAGLGKTADAAAIAGLLVFNSVVGALQQGRAQGALALLRTRLQVNARVRRDGAWTTLPAAGLVPGDVVRVRVGDVVPADLEVVEGAVEADQSSLSGESAPVEIGAGGRAFSGSTVTRGEATGLVSATGTRTEFGRTAELVRTASPPTHLETIVLSVVRSLVSIDLALIGVVLVATPAFGLAWRDALPFALVLLIASVPVALPATFTVAQALGSLELARAGGEGHGVLVTRLAAIQEAAAMDVLCTDKTGTLTLNQLHVGAVCAYPPATGDELLHLAAQAADPAGQDPIDTALLAGAPPAGAARRVAFVPFDPSTKRTEAVVDEDGRRRRLVKGAPAVVAALVAGRPPTLDADVERLAASGSRVIAVAAGDDHHLDLVGLVELTDPPRPDSARLVRTLRDLGVAVKMITGDSLPTARAVAGAVGIGERIAARGVLDGDPAAAVAYDGFAGCLPEDKYRLVQTLQQAGHVVAMTGDGVNDAPALRQAEVGIAVANATDVARSSASLVLTDPGLMNVVTAIETSRRVYRRMTTWILNKIIKTVQVAVFLTGALVWTRSFVTTPTLMVLLLFTNDFVTMALGTDRARPAAVPQRWKVGAITAAAVTLATVVLIESFLVLALARGPFALDAEQVRTATFVLLAFSGLATVYVVREHHWFWSSAPSRPLAVATAADVAAVSLAARFGVVMTPIPTTVIGLIAGVALAFMFLLDPLKQLVLRRFRLS